ncbi:hypothetical protein FKM82_000854 [Ascaphus truei]
MWVAQPKLPGRLQPWRHLVRRQHEPLVVASLLQAIPWRVCRYRRELIPFTALVTRRAADKKEAKVPGHQPYIERKRPEANK